MNVQILLRQYFNALLACAAAVMSMVAASASCPEIEIAAWIVLIAPVAMLIRTKMPE
jgi:hypothetical protein